MTAPSEEQRIVKKEFQSESSTKNRILDVAIDLFSKKGFSAVSIREITRTVGIRESSLYNHFKSKDEIMDTIFDYFLSEIAKMTPPEQDIDQLIDTLSLLQIFQAHSSLFKKGMKSPNMDKIWRIIAIEQYHNERIRKFVNQAIIDQPIEYFALLFEKMQKKHLIKQYDPKLLATEYMAFSVFMYFRYVVLEPERTLNLEDFDEMIEIHMRHFAKILDASGGEGI